MALADFGRDPRRSNRQAGEILFFLCVCPVNNTQFHRFPISQISRNVNTTTSIDATIKTFGKKFFFKFYRERSFFIKKTKKWLTKFQLLATSGRLNSAMITNRQKFTNK